MKKLHALTGIRAIAALWVILYHYTLNFPCRIDSPFITTFINKGYLGVDMFFILSGFIISYVHQSEFLSFPSPQTLRFLILRCARILPVHYFMLFSYVFFFLFKSLVLHSPSNTPEHNTFSDFICHLFNIQAWGLADHNSWNGPAWSVSAEWFAYLLFPLLTPVVGRLTGPRSNLGLILSCLAFLAGFGALMQLPTMNWTYHFGLVRIIAEFLVGCGLLNLFKQSSGKGVKAGMLAIIALLGLVGSIGFQWPDIVSVSCIGLLLFSLAMGDNLLTRFLSSRPLVYLGEVSYSLYMVHALFLAAIVQANQRLHFITADLNLQNLFNFIATVLGMMLAAHLMYQFVEVPSRNYIRSLLKKNEARLSKPVTA